MPEKKARHLGKSGPGKKATVYRWMDIGSGMPYRQRKEALLVFAELQELSSSHDANQQPLESC